ncbi:ABC transporter substrate-binding protein [Marivita sp.]|uniref:ABC transporter substrate-binding protein n=1 Tax=Marivita sp. TaxID=2003365 RepID=UPI002625F7DD|nr:ABC transporter substrate-binding protein [Marivita sp.]
MTKLRKMALAMGVAAFALQGAAVAEETYKIGISAGKTGYVATIDNAWVLGAELAADELNKSDGIMGKTVVVLSEDNKSEPQEAVKIYQKMINSDRVDIFASGCVSAGNLAAAGLLVRSKIPLVSCSILPKKEEERHWAFTTLPPPRFEVETRLAYLKANPEYKTFGVIFDPSPYAKLQTNIAENIAADFGLEFVGSEQYDQKDADLSVQIGKLNAAGADAILKMGVGGTTLTAANNIKQLGLDILLLTSLEDLAVFGPASNILGDNFMFVAAASQIPSALDDGGLKDAIDTFLVPWQAAEGDRDPNWAGRGWDAVMMINQAVTDAGSTDGPAVRDALEAMQEFQGTTGTYSHSPDVHQGLTENPLFLARIRDGKPEIVQ